MLCSHCSTLNPESNRFCGECGQPLVRQSQPVTVPCDEKPTFSGSHETTISGPSFLGLTDSSEEDAAQYLLEDEVPRGVHLGWFVFSVVAIAALAVIGWMEWQAIQTGKLPVPGLRTTSAGPAPQPTASSPTASTSSAPAGSPDRKQRSEVAKDSLGSALAGTEDSAGGVPDSSAAKVRTQEKEKSDAAATQERESRMAKEANARRRQESSDNSDEAASDSSEQVARPVSVTAPKLPDP